VILVDVVACSAALLLAYNGAAGSGGHSLADLAGLRAASGLELLFALVICLAAGAYTLLSFSRRVRI
jgi:hypothetical protein